MPRDLNLLFHCRSNGGGGAERVMSFLSAGLAARGHKVTLAVEIIDPEATPPAGVTLIDLPPGHAASIRALARLMRHGGFDLVHAGLALPVMRAALAKVYSLSATPLILSYHGFEEYKLARSGPLSYYGMPVLNRLAKRIVCVSDALTETMIQRWGAPKDRTVTIYNPVPQAVRPVIPVSDRPALIAAVARLSEEKGIADLIDAMALVKTPGARLEIAGDGPEAGNLTAQINRLGLSDRVRLIGPITDPYSLLATARVVAISSRTEAFSLVTVEALAAGAAVVATDCDGPREILEQGRYGTLVPISDPAAMAAALDAALTSPGDPADRIRRASDFSPEHSLDAWEALILSLVR